MFEIHHSDGRVERHFPTYAEAIAACATQYDECAIGHDGDLSDGGDRTLVWRNDAEAKDDCGARALATIRRAKDTRS